MSAIHSDGMTEGLFSGDRVVVRYRVDPTTRTDVTGVLVSDADPLTIDGTGPKERGRRVSVPRSAIESVRLLSYRTLRNSDIRQLAARIARDTAVESSEVNGWLLRAGSSRTRDNSAVPVSIAATTDSATMTTIVDWYRQRALSPLLAIPDRLIPAGQLSGNQIGGLVHVLVDPHDPQRYALSDADDIERGRQLRDEGFRLHHVMRYAQPATYGNA